MARGLGQNEGGKKIFVTCSHGVFVQRMKEATKDTIEREIEKGPNKGKTIHELHYQTIEGQLLNIEKKSHEDYGDSWEFTIDVSVNPEDDEKIILTVKSGYAKNIIMRLPNINFRHDVVLTAYSFTPKGQSKERKGISVAQSGNKVEPYYTKEKPNGLPQMVQVKYKGKLQWDDSDQMEFLEKMINDQIKPLLPEANDEKTDPTPAEQMENFENQQDEIPTDENGEKLPF